MFKSYLTTVKKITNAKALVSFIVLFVIALVFPKNIIPDLFGLGHLTNKKDIIFRLLSTTIGFSGILLTVLLVVYNFYVKTVRRNTLEFITDNTWIRRIFSLFFGNILFLSLGFFFVDSSPKFNDTSVLYCCYLVTITLILALFPLAILALGDSVSMKRVDKIINSIRDEHLDELATAPPGMDWFDLIENNPILVLRDLSVTAIVDRDWVLPQTVLSRLFQLIIDPLDGYSSAIKVQKHLSAWVIFCNSLKRNAIQQKDSPTCASLLKINLDVHRHLASKRVIHLRENVLDEFLKDLLRLIIESNMLFELQSHFLKYTTGVVRAHFDSLNYTDDEMPTVEFEVERQQHKQGDPFKMTPLKDYWFYLTHDLPNLIFDTVRYGIDANRRTVYNHYSTNIQFLLDAIFSHPNLTEHQKKNALEEISFRAEDVSKYAIDKGVFEYIDVVSHIQLEIWFLKDQRLAFRSFYGFVRMVKALDKKNGLSSLYLDKLFMIPRVLSRKNIDTKVYQDIVSTVLDLAMEMLKKDSREMDSKSALLYELKWFQSDYLLKEVKLEPLIDKYNALLDEALDGYELPV